MCGELQKRRGRVHKTQWPIKTRMRQPKPLVLLRRGGAAFRGCVERGCQRVRKQRERREEKKETVRMCVSVRWSVLQVQSEPDTGFTAAPDRGKTRLAACLSPLHPPWTTLRDVWRRRGTRPPPRGRAREPEDAGLEARDPGEEESEGRRVRRSRCRGDESRRCGPAAG